MADILGQIDAAIAKHDSMERNQLRFDPFGPDCRRGKGGIEKETVQPEAVVEEPGPPPAPVADSRQSTADFVRDVGAFRRYYGLYGVTSRPAVATCPPAPDPVADAFRAEVRRQGLAPCEIRIDGRPEWLSETPDVDPAGVDTFTAAMDSGGTMRWTGAAVGPGDVLAVGTAGRIVVVAVHGDGLINVELAAPPVDAALEPDLHRYECPRPGCDWIRLALDLDVFDGLLAEHESACHQPKHTPWWSRLLPSRRTR